MFYVYEFRDNNGPFYVGKGSKRRMNMHERLAASGIQSHFYKKLRKHLRDGIPFSKAIVFETLFEEHAFAEEKRLIALYGRENLTNATDGGEGWCGRKHSAETKRKLSDANKRRGPVSIETRRKMSEALKGKNTGPITDEHRAKLSAAKIGRPISEETKEKIRKAQTGTRHPWARERALKNLANIAAKVAIHGGTKWTEQQRRLFHEARVGHTVSQETRDKISRSKMGSIPWNKKKPEGEGTQVPTVLLAITP